MTSALLKEVNQTFRTEINDLLLSALVQTIGDWSKTKSVVIGMEGHGREDLFDEIDLSGTVGWFTSVFPSAFEFDAEKSLAHLIKNVKEQLRLIPDKGIGFGLLRYLHASKVVRDRLAEVEWDLTFNYLGQFDNVVDTSYWFNQTEESNGTAIHPNFPLPDNLVINSAVTSGQFNMTWSYSDQHFEAKTIEQLANAFIENLSRLIEFCRDNDNNMATPSDFGLGEDVSVQELDDLFGFDEIEDDGVLNF